MKAVPATTQVQVDGQFRLQRNGVALQWNTADEAALEAALQIKGSGAVTVDFTSSDYTEITTRSGNITINEACEKLAVTTDSGDVYCSYLAFVTAGNFTSQSGDVEIYMPDFSGVTLEFETACGSAETDLFGEAAKEPVYHSVTLERPAKLSHYLYVTTYSGRLKLYTLT